MRDSAIVKLTFAVILALLVYILAADVVKPVVDQFVSQTTENALDTLFSAAELDF